MNSDLNQKYFETKKAHQQSFNKKYLWVWPVLLLGFLVFYITKNIIRQKEQNAVKAKVMNQVLTTGAVFKNDSTVVTEKTKVQILVLEGCLFKELDNAFIATRGDSPAITYFMKRIIPDAMNNSLVGQWKRNVDSSFEFKDVTLDSTQFEKTERGHIRTVDSGATYEGKFTLIKTRALIYGLFILYEPGAESVLTSDIERILNSFKPMN